MIESNSEAEHWEDELVLEFYSLEGEQIAKLIVDAGFPVPDSDELIFLQEQIDKADERDIQLETEEFGAYKVQERVIHYTRNQTSIPDTASSRSGEEPSNGEPPEAEFNIVVVRLLVEPRDPPEHLSDAFKNLALNSSSPE